MQDSDKDTDKNSGVPLVEAARRLGLTVDGVRKRIQRGTITAYKREDRWFIVLDGNKDSSADAEADDGKEDEDSGQDGSKDTTNTVSTIAVTALSEALAALRGEMTDREAFLRAQLETRDREISELHVLLQNTQRLLPFGSEQETDTRNGATKPLHRDPESAQQGFWVRLFGLHSDR